MEPKIVFFDMDHTLIDMDCDVSWKDFLADLGLAEPDERKQADFFFEQYQRGELDVEAFLQLQLRQFRSRTPGEMLPLLQRHFVERILPLVYPPAVDVVRSYQEAGIPTALLTATNEAVAGPVAEHFGFDAMLATRLALRDGRYTGEILPPYCIAAEKIGYARRHCEKHDFSLNEAAYYGDSVNDIPLLEAVGFPVAVNPNGKLEAVAIQRGWPIERWERKT